MADRLRVYLLDDHEIVRRGIRDFLEATGDIEVVGESGTAAEATEQIPELKPDVAILDGRLPDGSGIEVCRAVLSAAPEVRALILTSYDDDEALFSAILAGASGYVLKDIRGSELLSGIRRVADGESLLDPSLVSRLMERVRNPKAVAPELEALTGPEMELLEHISAGLTNREIGKRMHLAESTVKNYVTALFAKLGVKRRTQAAVIAARLLDRD